MYNIDKLEALRMEYLNSKEFTSESEIVKSLGPIDGFINFIKEKENPVGPNQIDLKFPEDEK